jgi:hypothetical protein
VAKISDLTRDEMLNVLHSHRAVIIEADEWRPLADHILALIKMAYLEGYNESLDRPKDEEWITSPGS